MPTYEYECRECGEIYDRVALVSERNDPTVCPACQSEDTRRIMSTFGFVLKGENGWPTKAGRLRNQMARKNARLKKKEDVFKREAGLPTLAPNVDGEQVRSWSEAKKLAASKGKDTSTYEPYVRKENSKS